MKDNIQGYRYYDAPAEHGMYFDPVILDYDYVISDGENITLTPPPVLCWKPKFNAATQVWEETATPEEMEPAEPELSQIDNLELAIAEIYELILGGSL